MEAISARLGAGERLGLDEARELAAWHDLVALGMLADEVRRRRHGSEVTFVRVADVLATGGGTLMSMDVPEHAGELRILGTPSSLEEAVTAVGRAHAVAGAVPLSGFSLAHLETLPESLEKTLAELRQAGLELVGEAPLDALESPEKSLETARACGVGIARLTVQDAPDDWVAFCERVVTVQDAVGSLRAFAPLARRIDSTAPSTGYDDVKRVALARLLIDNVNTIQADWTLYGPKLAQVALTFGIDDLDAVSPLDDDSQGRRRTPGEEVRRSIEAAWLVPVERNARFERV